MDRVTRKWIRSPADERAAAAGCTFDPARADRFRTFARDFLRHAEGDWAGKPFELQDWQWLDWIAPLYGWVRADGTRRYRRGAMWVPKKNGKSALAAAQVLYGLIGDKEPAAQVFGGAIDRDQASTIFGYAANMVRQSELAKFITIIDSKRRLTFPSTMSYYAVLSKDSKKTAHGKHASLCVIDEVHVVDAQLYRTMRYAGAARRQPLLIEISTAGDDDTSFGFERYTYAERALKGSLAARPEGDAIDDPELLVVIYKADSNDGWDQEKQWHAANPSLGTLFSLDSFRADFEEAKRGTPADQASFRQLRLNLWQSTASPWLDVDIWDACAGWHVAEQGIPAAALEDLAYPLPLGHLVGRECFGGIDLSWTTDLAALALLWPDGEGSYDAACWYWVPEYACRLRERQNRQRLDKWIAEGWIAEVPGRTIDYELIRQLLRACNDLFRITRIGVDPYNAVQFLIQLQDEGFPVVEFGQTFANYNGPMKEMEKLLLAKRIRHGGNKVLRWNFGNIAVIKDANLNIRPSKKHAREKIDGMVAVLEALGVALKEPFGSVYDTRGIATLEEEPVGRRQQAASSQEEDAADVAPQPPAEPWGGDWHDDDEDDW